MKVVRQYLSAIGFAILAFQAGVLAMSPFVSCCDPASQQTIDDEDECCKGMGPGQICPLHKHRSAPKPDTGGHDSAGGPVLRCGCGQVDPALISLSFGLGVLAAPVSADVTFVSNPVAQATAFELWQAGSLDPPPPRA